jgi:hypothetical protein
MKISDLILPFKVILLNILILLFAVGCESNQEQIKTRIPASVKHKKSIPPPATPKPAPPDSLIDPDTIESHERIHKKPEIRTYKRVINFHKKPLIT